MTPIRKLPAQKQRVETGPVQFGDDWPGIFIRGDDAFAYAMILKFANERLEKGSDPLNEIGFESLIAMLMSCDLTGRNVA